MTGQRPLRRRIRTVAWLSSLGGGLATAPDNSSITSGNTGSSVGSTNQNNVPVGGSHGS